MDITPLHIHSSLTNCFNNVIFFRFYNELKFHILSRDGKMLGLSPGIKILILSKRGHSTFVLCAAHHRYQSYKHSEQYLTRASSVKEHSWIDPDVRERSSTKRLVPCEHSWIDPDLRERSSTKRLVPCESALVSRIKKLPSQQL